jgi:hypothetical protein
MQRNDVQIDDANRCVFESVSKIKKHLRVSTTEYISCEHRANILFDIYPWKAKDALDISVLLTPKKDILRKVVIPFYSAWNSLSNCVFPL